MGQQRGEGVYVYGDEGGGVKDAKDEDRDTLHALDGGSSSLDRDEVS